MPVSITLNELYQERRVKERSKKLSFDRVLELVHRRIRNVNSYGGLNTFYEIPGMLVGYPLFNVYDCMSHIIDELRTSGFLVQILPPPNVCVLYISWDPKEVKSNTTSKKPALTQGDKGMRALPPPPSQNIIARNNGKYF
jgi:hypothetical protein